MAESIQSATETEPMTVKPMFKPLNFEGSWNVWWESSV